MQWFARENDRMSSFLMNPSSAYSHHSVVVDPKFPPTEEYSQNNYISTAVPGPDYFGNHQQYGYHQTTGTPYSATTMMHIASNGPGKSEPVKSENF